MNMGAFGENFPYANFHDLNLDWIIKVVKNLDEKLDRAVASKIKVADPLQWDITKNYEEYTVVMNNDHAYLSIQPVPYNTPLSDTDYWQEVFDLGEVFELLKDSIAVADDGESTTSSANRTAGSLVWLNDRLMLVINDITAGETYTSSNTRQVSIEELIRIAKDQIFEEINSLVTYTNDQLSKKALKPDLGKYIIIGDSYTVMGLGNRITNILSLDSIVFPAGGGGFAGTSGTYTFKTALEEVAGGLTTDEKAEITDILVLGGYNDFSFTSSAIETAIRAFNTYARATFPNAQITLGMVSYSSREDDLGLIENVVIPTYSAVAMVLQWTYIPNANATIHFTSAMSSDGVHPVDGGITTIANYIAQFIHTRSAHYSARKRDYIHTIKLATAGEVYIDTILNDNLVTGILTTSGFVFDESYTFANNLNFSTSTLLGSFDGFARGNVFNGIPSIAIPVQVRSVWIDNTTFEDCDGVVYIVNGNVYLAIQRKYPDHEGSFVSKSFVIEPVSFTISADQC